jgi:hypothetical protein
VRTCGWAKAGTIWGEGAIAPVPQLPVAHTPPQAGLTAWSGQQWQWHRQTLPSFLIFLTRQDTGPFPIHAKHFLV